MSVLVASAEIARVMVEPRIGFGKFFSVDTGQPIMEVVFLEVALSRRRRKLGTRILAHLEKRYPNEILAAISEDSTSDEFWTAVK